MNPVPQSQGKKVTPGAVSPDAKPTVEEVEKTEEKTDEKPQPKRSRANPYADTW